MHGLIGERYLKRFFGSRLHRHRADLAGEALTLPENEGKYPSADKPAEPGCPPREVLTEKEATLENEKPGEINQLNGPENGSDQPVNDY